MTKRPEKLSRSPDARDVDDPRGDALGDVLAAALIRNVVYKRLELTAPWGLKIPERGHAMFYLVVRGSARLEVADAGAATATPAGVLALSAGDVAFLPRGGEHVLRDSPRTKAVSVCGHAHRTAERIPAFGGGGAPTSLICGFYELGDRRSALLAGLPAIISMSTVTSGTGMNATAQLIIGESLAAAPASGLVLQRLADVLLVQLLREFAGRDECAKAGVTALRDPQIYQALDLIHGMVAARWTVAQLARRVGMSRSVFAARFTDLVGEPPLTYLARWRLARAAEALRRGDDPIAAVAARYGYASVPSFTKAFKRWQGAAPAAFRRAATATATTPVSP